MAEIFLECYEEALVDMKEDYPNTSFPDICPFNNDVDKLLNDRFWELKNSSESAF